MKTNGASIFILNFECQEEANTDVRNEVIFSLKILSFQDPSIPVKNTSDMQIAFTILYIHVYNDSLLAICHWNKSAFRIARDKMSGQANGSREAIEQRSNSICNMQKERPGGAARGQALRLKIVGFQFRPSRGSPMAPWINTDFLRSKALARNQFCRITEALSTLEATTRSTGEEEKKEEERKEGQKDRSLRGSRDRRQKRFHGSKIKKEEAASYG